MVQISDEDVAAIPGAFVAPDLDIFRLILEEDIGTHPGNLAEMGVSFGASAVLIGSFLRPGETFTVIDLFGESAPDEANEAENQESYPGLTRAGFEQNYLRLHGTLPTVVTGPSESIVDYAEHGTHRFVHVDASHLFDHVIQDIAAAKILLQATGVVALDDIRAEHTPGVAAAAWQAVLVSGLKPFAISPSKLYATWGDPSPWLDAITRWVGRSGWSAEIQSVNGASLLRIYKPRIEPVARHPWKPYFPEVVWPLLARLRQLLGRGRL